MRFQLLHAFVRIRLGRQILRDQCDRDAIDATIRVDQVARDLHARILLFRQGCLRPGQRKQRAHFEARDGISGGGSGARGAGDDHPDGGELPKSHQKHSRSGYPGSPGES